MNLIDHTWLIFIAGVLTGLLISAIGDWLRHRGSNKLAPYLGEFTSNSTEPTDSWAALISALVEDKQDITTEEILAQAIGLAPNQHDRPAQMRVAGVMKRLAWHLVRIRPPYRTERIKVWTRTAPAGSWQVLP